jgi:hypothetical protein
MFEETQEEDKQSSTRGIIIAITVVVVLAIVGTLIYLDSKGALKSSSSTAATTSAPTVVANADPAKDLHVLGAKMDKDSTGLVAVWLVDVKNSSSTLTYSHIKYETTYGGADNNVIGQNQGEMKASIGPGEEQNVEFRDAQNPTGTAWFRVKITGGTATQ